MAKGVKITLFLADGTPDGLRIIEEANWSGRAYDFARADWPVVRARKDFEKPGVYVLSGLGDDGNELLYVGEADELRPRINQHDASLDFWTRATAFVSKDDSLNKAGVRYLESRLIALGHRARRAKLSNRNAPAPPSLSEADEAEALGFLEHMLPIYPVLGVAGFEIVASAAAPATAPRLRIDRGGIQAFGRDTAEGFVVETGSTARVKPVPSIHSYMQAIREQLIADGLLIHDGPTLRLTQDQVFRSPSTAAGVFLGRPASGPTEWHDDAGRTLKQLRADRAGQVGRADR